MIRFSVLLILILTIYGCCRIPPQHAELLEKRIEFNERIIAEGSESHLRSALRQTTDDLRSTVIILRNAGGKRYETAE